MSKGKLRRTRSKKIEANRQIPDQALVLIDGVLLELNTSVSQTMHQLLSKGAYQEMLDWEINPSQYDDVELFRRDYLAVEIGSKYPGYNLDVDRSTVALEKFTEAENSCKETNEFFRSKLRTIATCDISAHSVIETARRKIAKLLGEFDWDSCIELSGWGPGATTSLERRYGDAYYKYSTLVLDATHNLRPIVQAFQAWHPSWTFDVNWVDGARVTTVPKNAKTDRVIAIEPDLNSYIQKGIGRAMRRRLNKVGLLLKDAQLRNAAFAQLGSLTGELATIDLSAASDSVSLELVRALLPEDWVLAIELARSPVAILPSGEEVSLQKVSSMGNGFTFELETLVFWGLAKAVLELYDSIDHRLTVFGDDIIVPSTMAGYLIQWLGVVGFKTNETKTFVSGPFRESCGKHYFRGVDVTPFYVRKPINSTSRVYWWANAIKHWSRLFYGLDPLLQGSYEKAISLLKVEERRVYIPLVVDPSAGLHTDWDVAQGEISCTKTFNGLATWVPTYTVKVLGQDLVEIPARLPGRLRKSLNVLESKYPGRKTWDPFFGRHFPEVRYKVPVHSNVGDEVVSSVKEPKGTSWVKILFHGQWESAGPWLV